MSYWLSTDYLIEEQPLPYGLQLQQRFMESWWHIENISYEAEYDTRNKLELDLGRFHALHHREDPMLEIEDPEALKVDFTGEDNYVILNNCDWGHFVGTSL